MLLFDFLVAIFVSNLLQILNSLYGFLYKFADAYRAPPSAWVNDIIYKTHHGSFKSALAGAAHL